jgi:signal transduction histidine kinase
MLFDDVGAHLVVPIEMAEEVMGVLTVNHTGEAKYDAQDLHALLLLGSEVATAVTLARSRLRWVTVSKVLRAFLGVGLEPPTPDASLQAALAEALPLVAQHIRTALRCRSVLVFAASPQAPRDYHLLARQGKPLADLSEPVYVQGSPTLVGRAAAGPVSLVAERNEGAIERLAAVVQDHRRRAMAVVVCAGKTKPGGFTDDDQLLLGEVAEMSEIGFGHARSLDRVRRWLAASLARHATHQHQLVKPFAAIDKALREMKPQPPGVAEAIARMNEVREVTSTLLRLEQLERGAPDAWKETFHPLGVLGQVADDERERGRGIGVTLEVRSPIPEVAAIGDEGLVREALRCLVDNALKFCSRPGRAVLACREAESAGPPGGGAFAPDGLGGGVEVETWGQALVVGERTGLLPGTCTLVSVENTGPRIPEDLRGIIFTQGYSTTPKADKSRWGFGFGLSIVYQVADVHGGGVVVQNMPDGVKFTLVLPH